MKVVLKLADRTEGSSKVVAGEFQLHHANCYALRALKSDTKMANDLHQQHLNEIHLYYSSRT